MSFTSLRRRALALLVGACLVLSGLSATAPPASAACGGDFFYTVQATSVRMPFKGMPIFKNGPGGTVTTSRSTSKSVSYGVVAGAESEVGAVLAKAKVSISASLTRTNSTSVVNTYSRKISRGKYGNLQYVSWAKRVTWQKKKERLDCSIDVRARGVIKFPTIKEGWYYWETRR